MRSTKCQNTCEGPNIKLFAEGEMSKYRLRAKWSITRYPEIAWPPGAPINIKIVASTLGYPVKLNRHNALTFFTNVLHQVTPAYWFPPRTIINLAMQRMKIMVLGHFIQRLSCRESKYIKTQVCDYCSTVIINHPLIWYRQTLSKTLAKWFFFRSR